MDHSPPSTPSPDHHDHGDHTHDKASEHGHGKGRAELGFAITACVCTAVGWGLGQVQAIDAPRLVLGLFLAGYFFGGFFTLREAFEHLKARSFEIDLLMLVAALGAALLGEWFEGALLLSLFSLGHSLEHYAMGKAKRAIESLGDLAPDRATVRREGALFEVNVSELVIGDIVLVKPDERIPADGFVIEGQSAVNQAPVTGESMPVDKYPAPDPALASQDPKKIPPAHRLYAGTINGPGALTLSVTQLASQSTLARVIDMVKSAQAMQSPTQQLTAKFERIFVPSILLLVALLHLAFLVLDEPFSQSFYRAMAVLVAASPCALAIATPSAVLSAVAAGGKSGVLVKGGAPLEHLGTIKAIAFDKTGTLTQGEPHVVESWTAPGVDAQTMWSMAAAVERLSDHPLAQAIVRHVEQNVPSTPVLDATQMQSVTGRGVRAQIQGSPVLVGNASLFEGDNSLAPDTLAALGEFTQSGHTVMAIKHQGRDLGVIGLMDTPREGVKDAITALRALGMSRMIMISGDHQNVADAVAAHVGLDEAHGGLMPEDKVAFIRELGREGSGVCMVGDGVNDAPAMAHATVAIAMGAAGSDTALETAQIALMSDDITRLPYAVGLGRKTSRIIAQNLWLSLGMVAFLIPATLFGLSIGPAVALHEGSTLLVVFNALRLLKYRLS